MTQNNGPYIRPIPVSWWLKQKRYVIYMIRELSCLFIALSAVIVIAGIYHLSQGEESFSRFLAQLWGPTGIGISIATCLMCTIHSITWFQLTPKAMPLWIGEKKVPGWMIIGGNVGVWLVISAIVFFVAKGGF